MYYQSIAEFKTLNSSQSAIDNMLRNFQSVICVPTKETKQLKERSYSLRNIKANSSQDLTSNFDRVCSTNTHLKQFARQSTSMKDVQYSLYAVFSTEGSQKVTALISQIWKATLSSTQQLGNSYQIRVQEVEEPHDGNPGAVHVVSQQAIQFYSEAKKVLACGYAEGSIIRLYSLSGCIGKTPFQNVIAHIDIDWLRHRERLQSILSRGADHSRKNDSYGSMSRLMSRGCDYGIYVVALAGQDGKFKQKNAKLSNFCLQLSQKILNAARRNSKKLQHCSNKENIENQRSSSGIRFQNVSSRVGFDDEEDPATSGRSKIALKKKQGFDRLLMQLESENRALKARLSSQQTDFEQQSADFLQKCNRKVGKIKLELEEVREHYQEARNQISRLQSQLSQQSGKPRRQDQHLINSLQKQKTQLSNEVEFLKRLLQDAQSEKTQQNQLLRTIRQERDKYRRDIEQFKFQAETDRGQSGQLKQYCRRLEEEAKLHKQNETKYLQQISKLQYRFLKERGKYIAEKNTSSKLSKQLELMDERLNQIIELKNKEISGMAEDSIYSS